MPTKHNNFFKKTLYSTYSNNKQLLSGRLTNNNMIRYRWPGCVGRGDRPWAGSGQAGHPWAESHTRHQQPSGRNFFSSQNTQHALHILVWILCSKWWKLCYFYVTLFLCSVPNFLYPPVPCSMCGVPQVLRRFLGLAGEERQSMLNLLTGSKDQPTLNAITVFGGRHNKFACNSKSTWFYL